MLENLLINNKPSCLKTYLTASSQSKTSPVPISPGHPLVKDRGSLRSALWKDRLAEPPHQKNGCPVDVQTPLQPQ
jgi:hypothetical protein